MKDKKKALAATLSETVQKNIIDSPDQAKKLKKAIKKMAKGLAETIVKFTVKEDKKLKRTIKLEDHTIPEVKKKSRKQKKETRLTTLEGLVTSERALLSTGKDNKDINE